MRLNRFCIVAQSYSYSVGIVLICSILAVAHVKSVAERVGVGRICSKRGVIHVPPALERVELV